MGIDYGMGNTNIDTKTGIRFGVIAQHEVGEAWYDSSDPNYGSPQIDDMPDDCPYCHKDINDCEAWDWISILERAEWGMTIECPYCEEYIEIELHDMAEPICHYVKSFCC